MKNKQITDGPVWAKLFEAYRKEEPVPFTIDGTVHEAIPHGMEMYDASKGMYDIKVTVLGLKMPAKQHFRFSPETGQGEWLGYFDLGHKAYDGHSTPFEDDPSSEESDLAHRNRSLT